MTLDFHIADTGRLRQRMSGVVKSQELVARDALVSVADNIVRGAQENVLANREAPPSVPSPLAASIGARVAPDKVVVGTRLEYAPFVELGTHRQAAEPFLQPAFDGAIRNLRLSSPRAGVTS